MIPYLLTVLLSVITMDAHQNDTQAEASDEVVYPALSDSQDNEIIERSYE